MPRTSRPLVWACIAILALLMTDPSVAMTDLTIKFQRLMLADGLTQSSIVALHQDSRGFIWMGTQDGLNRYDGHQIRTFKPDPEDPHSLSDANIWCIAEDASGDLWIGTEGGGFNRFDRTTETFECITRKANRAGSLDFYEVRAIVADPDGIIWVGTMGDGLLRYDPTTGETITYTGHLPGIREYRGPQRAQPAAGCPRLVVGRHRERAGPPGPQQRPVLVLPLRRPG